MICPHCNIAARFEWNRTGVLDSDNNNNGIAVGWSRCPDCFKLIISLLTGPTNGDSDALDFMFDHRIGHLYDVNSILFPRSDKSILSPDFIPEKYYKDYLESFNVLKISPKASATLNRRLLQLILQDSFYIKKGNLSQEINEFINLPGIPSHLTEAVHAVRVVGNFAAHPTKEMNTGEIVCVEPGEAEWLFEVISALFDYCFIQPKKLHKRKEELNKKLKEIDKPPLT